MPAKGRGQISFGGGSQRRPQDSRQTSPLPCMSWALGHRLSWRRRPGWTGTDLIVVHSVSSVLVFPSASLSFRSRAQRKSKAPLDSPPPHPFPSPRPLLFFLLIDHRKLPALQAGGTPTFLASCGWQKDSWLRSRPPLPRMDSVGRANRSPPAPN